MALSLCVPSQNDSFIRPRFFSLDPCRIPGNPSVVGKKSRIVLAPVSCSFTKPVRSRQLDRYVVEENKIRFVQKLKQLLLSNPQHYIPLHILSKCRSFLSLSEPCSIASMIHRYPTIFQLFTMPRTINSRPQVCVRLTRAASALAARESHLQFANSVKLATKLQKLLMLSSHHCLLLSKLVHIAPDLGLPDNFQYILCNDHPKKFRIISTSFGNALELVSWDARLAVPLSMPIASNGLVRVRPPKFKLLRLRKGLNIKRSHQEFLLRFGEQSYMCPYNTSMKDFAKESMEFEKRACSVVREVLEMTIGRRTLIDHVALFRKEFGLPNNLRAMILRHPELFYVSFKGPRDSVLLLECFDEEGMLLEKDEILAIRDQMVNLVAKSGRMRRLQRKLGRNNNPGRDPFGDHYDEFDDSGYDGLENVLESEDSYYFDNFDASSVISLIEVSSKEPW